MENRTLRLAPGGGFDQISIDDEGAPRPPSRGEITVRLRASSLNYHDYGVVKGPMAPRNESRIPLADGAGEVIAVGDHVNDFAIGDAVVSTFFPHWLAGEPDTEGFGNTPGDGIDGFAREQVTLPETAFTRAPAGWSHAEAATLTTAGVTAWRSLFVHGDLKPGQTVLTLGTGGVSIYALQLAVAAGARVISTSSSDTKLERLKSMGAEAVINYSEHPDWGQAVRALTAGRGVDHVVEVGGPGTLEQSMIATAVGGHVSLIGVLTGVKGDFPLIQSLLRQLRLQGVLVGSRRDQQDTVAAMEAMGLHPVIDRHFPLESLVEAFQYEESGAHFGKICIDL
ncbi:MAG: NAD(P)-dependent alcohol dehydrogenase [Spiribacter sp.]|jgi:NADPH:quinone reductase-like Zn-dependent oxidoreductase|nr:NAD(P)-dependent alcohol dehydrogenase [Spiribacter sp.]MDR9490001.1 NAD(P)-dependent alcohol dehydrogenase [Spiribacter sp.]